MNIPGRSHLIVGLVMMFAAGLTVALTPSKMISGEGLAINLETMIPKQFAGWWIDPGILPLEALGADPNQTADTIYSQVLMRTYVNAQGEQVMLTIAYGSSQSDTLQLHRPEVCYAFQGFQVDSPRRGEMQLNGRVIPVQQLFAVNGQRYEPITYWIVVGKRLVEGRLARKLEQLKYGLTGVIPDGILVRISSITKDQDMAYGLHQEFISALYGAMETEDAKRLLGLVEK